MDLIGSRARVIQLETQLHSIERDCKKARYEQELELITNYPKSLKLELELDDLKQKYQTAKGEIVNNDFLFKTFFVGIIIDPTNL